MNYFEGIVLPKKAPNLAVPLPSKYLSGHKNAFQDEPLSFLINSQKHYGDLSRMRFGPFWIHNLSAPAEVYAILVEKQKYYSKNTAGYRLLSRALGQGLLTSEGDMWRRQRRIAQPAFRKNNIAELAEIMTVAASETVAQWGDGQTIDLSKAMNSLALRIAGETLFDVDLSDSSSEVSKTVDHMMDSFQSLMTSTFASFTYKLPLPENLRLKRKIEELDRVVYDIIEKERNANVTKSTLLRMFMDAKDEDGSGMSDLQLRDEVLTMLLAGHETSANALVWTLYHVATHKTVAQRIVDELNATMGESTPTIKTITSMNYLRQVILESLRLFPPAWTISRRAEREDRILGKRIPKGAIVLMSPYVLHRRAEFWPNPNDFEPDRFKHGVPPEVRGSYWPFLVGVRKCIGEHFAMTELMIVLATILSRFTFALSPGQDIQCDPSVTLRPKSGIKVKLTKRQ